MTQKVAQSDLFHPVRIQKMSDLVFEDLQEKILNGTYAPGQKLPSERMLIQIYEKSHPTIREALRMLESAGYIEVIPGGGAVVRALSHRQIEEPLLELLLFRKVPVRDIIEFLFASEPEIAGIAAERRTQEDLDAFSSLSRRQKALGFSDEGWGSERVLSKLNEMFQLIREFHILIAAASHNPLMSIIWSSLFRMIEIDIAGESRPGVPEKTIRTLAAAHDCILESIRRMDRRGAEEAVSSCFDVLIEQAGTYFRIRQDDGSQTDALRPKKAPEAIYDQIRTLILEGKLRPGERLPSERQLVELFDKSRTSIREALKMLEQKNYVTIARGSGTIVNDISTYKIERALNSMLHYRLVSCQDVLEVRRISETLAAEWAAARKTPAELAAIRAVIDESNRSVHDRIRMINCGIEFTVAVSKAAHNEVVHVISRVTSSFLHDRYREHTEEDALEEHMRIVREHTKIMYEVGKGSVSGAREATNRHLKGVENILL